MHNNTDNPTKSQHGCIDCDLALAHLEHFGKRKAVSLPGAHHTLAVRMGIAPPSTNEPAAYRKRKKVVGGRCTVEVGEEIDRLFSQHIPKSPYDEYGLLLPTPPGGNVGSVRKPPRDRTRSLLHAGLEALKERGIQLWASQVALPCEHIGCAPVLDLLGWIPAQDRLVVIEVKTSGSAALQKATLGPDIVVPVWHRAGDVVNMCIKDTWKHRHLLQLSLQCHCARSILGHERGVPHPEVDGLLLVLSGYDKVHISRLPTDYRNVAWDVLLGAQN